MADTGVPLRRVECDVLVIGGSTAGLMAALEARKGAANVVVVCKRKAGRSGNTIVSAALFSACVPGGDPADSIELHFHDTLAAGHAVNDRDLVAALTAEGPAAVMGLESHGVGFLRLDGELVRRHSPGHSYARSFLADPGGVHYHARGLSINLPLLRVARERGATFFDDMPVHRLLVRDGAVGGALALDTRSGEQVLLLAKSVILAAGGGGRIFAHNNNTVDVTGDSAALALEAGARLRDMEFVQLFPTWMIAPVRGDFPTGLFAEGAVLRNRHGERFMARYDPVKADMAPRDTMSKAIFREVQAGNGVQGGVYADCTGVDPVVLARRFASWAGHMQSCAVDVSKQWLLVSPSVHFMMGGAWIDERCRTNVEGLFAAGEAAGGAHGANRIAGNALVEAVVFGLRAGREAAAHARHLARAPEPSPRQVEIAGGGSGSVSLAEVKAQVRRAMWDHVSIVRNEAGLRRAREMLGECEESLPRCRVKTLAEVAARLEVGRMLLMGQAIVACAMERRESRGAHWREDFPSQDDTRWLGSTGIAKEGEEIRVTFVEHGGAQSPGHQGPRSSAS